MARAAAISLFAICLSALAVAVNGPGNPPHHPHPTVLTAAQAHRLTLAYEAAATTTPTEPTGGPVPPPVRYPTTPPESPTTVPAPIPPTTVPEAPQGDSEGVYEAWSRVAACEEGGWIGYAGSAYPNSLGISAPAWYGNGGGSDVSPAAQIAVAERVIDSIVGSYVQDVRVYPGYVPDQNGCAGSW